MSTPGKSSALSRSIDGSPHNQVLKIGYALRRKGEVVYSWHRVRLKLTERELVISTVSERDFMLVGHMIDMLSGTKSHNNETHLRYDLEEEDFHFFSFYFTWSVTGKKYGFQFDILSENRNVHKSFCFCFDTEEEQDEWESAFRKVENRIRSVKQMYLTEANAKRREAVRNNISTLILIARNYKEEPAEPEGDKMERSNSPALDIPQTTTPNTPTKASLFPASASFGMSQFRDHSPTNSGPPTPMMFDNYLSHSNQSITSNYITNSTQSVASDCGDSLSSSLVGINTSLSGLPTPSSLTHGLDAPIRGLNNATHGLNTTSYGLDVTSHGLNISTSDLNVSSSDLTALSPTLTISPPGSTTAYELSNSQGIVDPLHGLTPSGISVTSQNLTTHSLSTSSPGLTTSHGITPSSLGISALSLSVSSPSIATANELASSGITPIHGLTPSSLDITGPTPGISVSSPGLVTTHGLSSTGIYGPPGLSVSSPGLTTSYGLDTSTPGLNIIEPPWGYKGNNTETTASSSSVRAGKGDWYYFSNKKSYKYYRVAPGDEVADQPPIEVPYYFSSSDTMSDTARDFSLPEPHPQVLGDFNRRFQEAVKGISVSRRLHITGQDLVKPYLNLIHISQDFVHTATTYGKIIINEVYLPPEKKKIKPIDVGGLAGGLKFIVQNILFKFAIDYFDLYGSDEAAAKVAGHDLRGLTHYFECGIEDLCVPLTMLLDYRGFRLICQAVMPISQDTICYGSSDGGEHVYCSDKELYEKLCRAAKMLNLKPHLCRNSQDIMLVSAIDLEGHRGKDKRHYLCDFSRVFPPELPHPNIRSSYMYRLLRPEFLRTLATPLCSDSFSWFIQKTPQEKDHNREVSLATNYLLNTTIPAFSVVLIKLVEEAADKNELAAFHVTAHIHSNGINIRHCGHLISLIRASDHVHNDSTIFVLHIEMVARILKILIRVKLRTKMQELKLPLEEPYRCLLVDFLNLVFGHSTESTNFWNTTIRSHLHSKFCYSLDTTDLKVDLFSMCPGENGLLICFLRLLEMTKMKVASRLLDQFSKSPATFLSKKYIIHETDLLKIGFTTKQMNVVDFAQGFVLKARGDEYLKDDKATAKHFYNLALQKYEDSLHANPYNKWTLVNTAEVLTRLLELEDSHSLKQEEERLLAIGRINKMYMRAINLDQNDSYSLYSYAKFLEKHSDNSVTVIEEFYLRSLENDPANCLCLSKYAQFLLKHNYPDYEMFKRLETQLSTQLTQVKDLYSTLSKCRLDRQDRIWHARSHKTVTNTTLTLSHHRKSIQQGPLNIQKCARCSLPFVPNDNHGGQCAHVGTWHSSFLDCNLDCVFYLSGNFSFGIPHWSCCFSFNGTTTVCGRSAPHQGAEKNLRLVMDDD